MLRYNKEMKCENPSCSKVIQHTSATKVKCGHMMCARCLQHYLSYKVKNNVLSSTLPSCSFHISSDQCYMAALRDEALIKSCVTGNPQVIKALIDSGADVRTDRGNALVKCCEHGHTEAALLLLGAGADIEARNGMSLRQASSRGHFDTVAMLVNKGANIHAQSDNALYNSARLGRDRFVDLLLNAGANVHTCNNACLRIAAVRGHVAVAKLLLARGAYVREYKGFVDVGPHSEFTKLLSARRTNIPQSLIVLDDNHAETVNFASDAMKTLLCAYCRLRKLARRWKWRKYIARLALRWRLMLDLKLHPCVGSFPGGVYYRSALAHFSNRTNNCRWGDHRYY